MIDMKHGWEIKRLGNVVKTEAGGTPRKSHKEYYEGGTIPWLLSGEVSQGLIYKSKNFITKKGLENSSAKLFPINTVLVAMYGATVGQVGVLKCEAATNQAVCGILPNNILSPEFLYYFFLSKKDDFIAQAVGNAQPNISQIKIKNTEIPVPPLETQKQIVAVLDKAFAAIDVAKANIEKNLQNAKELFQSKLNQIFTQKGDGGEEKTLGESVKSISTGPFGSLLHKSDYTSHGVPLVNPINMVNKRIVADEKKQVAKEVLKRLGTYVLKTNDVVVARRGEIGRCALVEEKQNGWLCGTGSFFISLDDKLRPDFLVELISSEAYSKKLLKVATGATMKNISNKSLKALRISFPNLETQKKIMGSIIAMDNQAKQLEVQYQQKLDNLDELKKSILQKAFAGGLT